MKVYVGLSGGVDSAVSAALLKQEGYDVVGIFMKNWSGDEFGIQADCPWEEDQKSAEDVAKHIGIEFQSFNFEKEYRDKVVEYFFSEYERGRTPNPDVMCNKEIKFKLFLEKSLKNGADLIATGHYARKIINQNGLSELHKGVDQNKDQTYFLHALNYEQLNKSMFPIGNYQKTKVRELARAFKLPNAERPDSQGICFIGEINVLKFLMSRIPEKIGNIVDIDSNEIVGQHKGSYFYTIGQREGLGIGGQKTPYFVVDKDVSSNIVYVGHGTDHPSLFKKIVELENIHFINYLEDTNFESKILTASIRYRQQPQPGKLNITSRTFEFDEPQRAVTSGQSLVLYQGEKCLGGGVIK